MVAPPFDGAVKDTDMLLTPPTAAMLEGASGMVKGVTFTLLLFKEKPDAFCALTAHTYCVPFTNPVTVMGLALPLSCATCPPPLHTARYDVIAELPGFAGGVNEIVACALPAAAVTAVGAPGTVMGAVASSPGQAASASARRGRVFRTVSIGGWGRGVETLRPKVLLFKTRTVSRTLIRG